MTANELAVVVDPLGKIRVFTLGFFDIEVHTPVFQDA